MRRLFYANSISSVFDLPKRLWITNLGVGLFSLLLIAPAFGQSANRGASCENLAKLILPATTINLAQQVAAGEFKLPAGARSLPEATLKSIPAFCRVAATLKPSSDSSIRIEVWLPVSGWNGKLLAAGNGGWGGEIAYDGLIDGVRRGYAATSTDTGHDKSVTPGGSFIPGHPEKWIDYAYRAVHEMTVKAKAIVKGYYGNAPKYSYFIGCSLGGLQALTEARRFPEDFDGIISGAPANPMTIFNAAQLWPTWLISKDPARFIPPEKYPIVHEAVLKACDELNGVKDGVVDDPPRCRFDPQQLLCKGADGPDCLTAPQVDLMKRIYAGPVNPRTGQSIFPGPAIGGELQLPRFAAHEAMLNALDLYRYAAFKDPKWDWRTLTFDSDIAAAVKTVGPDFHVDSNLSAFFDRGGKLMIYIGWTDYHNPEDLIAYHNAVLKNARTSKPGNSLRLFTIPGMDHCQGGAGCDTFEKIGTMEQWVEQGKAPTRIIASHQTEGKVIFTRPLCAYPQVAKYRGTGNTDSAENWLCTDERVTGKP